MRLCHDELQKSNAFTKSMDLMTYNSAYLMGCAEPRYQLPVDRRAADISIGWSCISHCQCRACIFKFLDHMEYTQALL